MSIDYPTQVIDVHTHVFNAHHLPLEGMLLGWLDVKTHDGKRFRRWLARMGRNIAVQLVASEARRTNQPKSTDLDWLLDGRSSEDDREVLLADIVRQATGRYECRAGAHWRTPRGRH